MWNGKPIKQKLVLVVDDDRVVRGSISRLLGMNGILFWRRRMANKPLNYRRKRRISRVWFCSIWRCRSWTVTDS